MSANLADVVSAARRRPDVGVVSDIVDIITPVLPAAGTTNTANVSLMDMVLRNYSVGRLFGMPVLIDGNQAPDSDADVKYGCFAAGEGGGRWNLN